jgi:hypothetical protein
MTRSREGEEKIPLEYLISCSKYHEDMMLFFSNNNLLLDKPLILDGNVNIYQNTNKMEDWIVIVKLFIHTTSIYDDMPELISDSDSDTYSDMPDLISDTDSDMPDLIEVD